jgi:iron complex outermembrane recepter protein
MRVDDRLNSIPWAADARHRLTPNAARSKRNSVVATAVAAALMGAAAPAVSQSIPSANPGALDDVVVTGIRASIANAIQLKEFSDNIVETISAEDLGKLPDISIADSLARLPGLAAQRNDGHANFISIRGFAPDFSGTTLAGREIASTGENRGVEFDQFPAELVHQVEVYKTPDASLIGQGLAGTVNLDTVKPLSYNEMKVAVNARAERNSNSNLNPGQGIGADGSRLSFSVIDQFMDHTLGVAFGVARIDSPVQERQYQAWWWAIDNGPAGSGSLQGWGTNPVPGAPDSALEQQGMQIRAKSVGDTRTGVMGVIEYAPSNTFHSELDLFYSEFKQDDALNGLQWSSSPWDGVSYANAQTSGQGANSVLTSGSISGVKPIMQNEYTSLNTRTVSLGWNNRLDFDSGWTAIADLSYSQATDSLRDAYAFTGLQGGATLNGVGFNIPPGGGYASYSLPVNMADPTIVGFTDPDNYGYNGREEWDHQTDTIKAFRLDVKHALGWIFKTVDIGFDYSDRKKSKSALVDFAYLNGNGCSTTGTLSCGAYNSAQFAPVGAAYTYSPTSLAYAGVPGVINYNILAAFNSQFYLSPDMGPNDYSRNYYIQEKVPLGYLKLDIDTHMGQVPVRGNVGVQWVHTNQYSSGVLTDPNSGQPTGAVGSGTSYNEVLPSLNLVAMVAPREYIRLGVSKSMMRGRIDDEKAASSASVCTDPASCQASFGFWSGSGGNPYLKPYIAIGEDLSFEKMFGKASYFSVALFNKNLTSYIYTQTDPNYNFSGFVNNTPITPKSVYGNYSTPENGSGGKIQGYELALTLEGGLLANALSGFGLQSSYAYTNNYLPPTTISNVPGGPTTFPGFSKNVAAVTVYYEQNGYSLRLAETYRSPFTGEVTPLFNQLSYTKIATDRTLNFQAGYEFKEGKAAGLSLLLQVNNLTDSPYRTIQMATLTSGASYQTPLENDTFGRTILLGFNYKR